MTDAPQTTEERVAKLASELFGEFVATALPHIGASVAWESLVGIEREAWIAVARRALEYADGK